MKTVEKFKTIINSIEPLIQKRCTSDSLEFKSWHEKTIRFLAKQYGSNSDEMTRFKEIWFSPGVWTYDMTDRDYIEVCTNGLREAREILLVYLEDLEEEQNDMVTENENIELKTVNSHTKVFVVHGHNGEMKEAVARLIEKQGIQAIILHEQANQGATIIEKFERNSDVGGAICLFTADDLGRAKADAEDKKRARQNVVFEAGYFIGKLGRKNVILIADKGVEIPSDLQGVVYTESTNWQFSVLKELKAMGYCIDYNKID